MTPCHQCLYCIVLKNSSIFSAWVKKCGCKEQKMGRGKRQYDAIEDSKQTSTDVSTLQLTTVDRQIIVYLYIACLSHIYVYVQHIMYIHNICILCYHLLVCCALSWWTRAEGHEWPLLVLSFSTTQSVCNYCFSHWKNSPHMSDRRSATIVV